MTHCKQLHTLHTNTDRMDPRSLPSNIFFFLSAPAKLFSYFCSVFFFCEPRLLAHTPGSDANSSRCRNMATWYRCCINFALFFFSFSPYTSPYSITEHTDLQSADHLTSSNCLSVCPLLYVQHELFINSPSFPLSFSRLSRSYVSLLHT